MALDPVRSESASQSVGPKRRRDRPSLVLKATLADLDNWFGVATAGDGFEYHRGILAMDRGVGSRLGEDDRKELGRVADAAMILAKSGRAHLVQRRRGPDDYTYIALAGTSPRRIPGRKQMRETAS